MFLLYLSLLLVPSRSTAVSASKPNEGSLLQSDVNPTTDHLVGERTGDLATIAAVAHESLVLTLLPTEPQERIADKLECTIDYSNGLGNIHCPGLCGPGRNWLVIRQEMTDGFGTIVASVCGLDCGGNFQTWDCTSADIAYTTDPNIVCNLCTEGITGGGGLRNCFFNQNGYWQCFHQTFPLPFVPAPMSSVFFVCNDVPEIEPTPENCGCVMYLGNPTVEPWDFASKSCQGCSIQPSSLDGMTALYWDCSNQLVGDCVGQDENGCISNVPGPPSTPEPTPALKTPVCGDGVCEDDCLYCEDSCCTSLCMTSSDSPGVRFCAVPLETCSSCPQDCGECENPTPTPSPTHKEMLPPSESPAAETLPPTPAAKTLPPTPAAETLPPTTAPTSKETFSPTSGPVGETVPPTRDVSDETFPPTTSPVEQNPITVPIEQPANSSSCFTWVTTTWAFGLALVFLWI